MSTTPYLQRDRRLDTLRGLFLVIMLIDHLGGQLARVTYQPLGYMSAAEGFFFLSGLMFGQIYARYLERPGELWQRALARAGLIYRYHAATVIVIAALALLPVFDHLWYYALKPWHEVPLTSTLAMLALIHQPSYLNILPLYILFVLLSPGLLLALHNGWRWSVVLGSVSIWLVGQWGSPLLLLYRDLHLPWNPGYFNLASWQVLWVGGLTLGYARHRGEGVGFAASRAFLIPVALLVLVLMLGRREWLDLGHWLGGLLDKPGLGPVRLLNCLLLISLIGWALTRYRPEAHLPFAELLGRYSIQVFAFHGVLLYLLQGISAQIKRQGEPLFAVYTLTLVLCLLIPVGLARGISIWRGRPA